MLELFPTAVLDTSILTSVMVGLLFVWLLQEWLGWGLTALVVPGYLASVLAIQPLTAAVMVGEAVATWLVMVALSDALPRWWPWFPLFGRDRFFLALLGSVGVRLGLEGALLPALSGQLGVQLSSELHSMGLVVVPLTAYAIWRNGPVRALPRLGVPLLLTWAVLELVLLAHTNLSLASFELTYEDLALDFVGSPRAYVLLLAGAWLGSVANLRYGWDFGGIIVPGLLALCWLQPERLAATIGEAVVIAVALHALLRTPGLSRLNLTGGRLLVLGVLVGYLLKYALGHLFGGGWPGLRLRQLFGFGYLLPTLMALRMVRSADPLRTLVPSVLTSLSGFLGGTAVAWLLAVALPPERPVEAARVAAPSAEAALQAAWWNQGPVPLELEAAVDAGRPALLTGGEGFGALWLRGEGQPLVVATQVGEPGLAEATLAVAEAVQARAVLLCAPTGPACAEARRRLGFRLPVLVVAPDAATGLHSTSRLDEALPGVEPALAALVGPLPRQPAEGEATLALAPATRLRLAAGWRPEAPAPWQHPAWTPLVPEASPDMGALALATHSLARPLARWAATGVTEGAAAGPAEGAAAGAAEDPAGAAEGAAGAAEDAAGAAEGAAAGAAEDAAAGAAEGAAAGAAEDAAEGAAGAAEGAAAGAAEDAAALALAAATARRLGARLSRDGDRVSVVAPGWRLVVRRGGQPIILTLPFADDAPELVPLSLSMAVASDAVAWLADGPPTWSNEAQDDQRVTHHLLLGLLQELGPAAEVVSVAGLRDLQDPGGEVVLTRGRPASEEGDPRLAEWAARLRSLGAPPVVYDGAARRLSFRGGAIPARAAARAATGREAWVGLYAGSLLRSRARPVDAHHRLHDVLVAGAPALWQVEASALEAAAGPADPAWQGWRDAVAALVETGLPAARTRAWREAARRGARTGLVCEPLAGCRWLAALRCTAAGCEGALAPLEAGLPPTEAGAPALDRLLLGDGRLDLAGLPSPASLPAVEAPR